MLLFWSAAIVIFLIVEGLTVGLTAIWFALGSAAALISSLFGAPLWLQIIWFVIISGVTVYFTRPLAKKYINSRAIPTNADMVIGAEGIVTENIDNLEGTGLVSVSGKLWTARSASDRTFGVGEHVQVASIQGVKLIVEPVMSTANV